MAELDYATATKTQITDEIVEEHRQKKLAEIENNVKKTFFEARSEVFKALEDAYKADVAALQVEWQAKEDAGYVV